MTMTAAAAAASDSPNDTIMSEASRAPVPIGVPSMQFIKDAEMRDAFDAKFDTLERAYEIQRRASIKLSKAKNDLHRSAREYLETIIAKVVDIDADDSDEQYTRDILRSLIVEFGPEIVRGGPVQIMNYLATNLKTKQITSERPSVLTKNRWRAFYRLASLAEIGTAPRGIEAYEECLNDLFEAVFSAALSPVAPEFALKSIALFTQPSVLEWWAEYNSKDSLAEYSHRQVISTFACMTVAENGYPIAARALDLIPGRILNDILERPRLISDTCVITDACWTTLSRANALGCQAEMVRYLLGRAPPRYFAQRVYQGNHLDDWNVLLKTPKTGARHYAYILHLIIKVCTYDPSNDFCRPFLPAPARELLGHVFAMCFTDAHRESVAAIGSATSDIFNFKTNQWETFTTRQLIDEKFPGEFLDLFPVPADFEYPEPGVGIDCVQCLEAE